MGDRFAQYSQLELFMRKLGPDGCARSGLDTEPNWNLAPSQEAWAIIGREGQLAPVRMRWGSRPSWAKAGAAKPINACVETVAGKPYFREAWGSRRCIVPADHYYEWQATPAGKRPFLIRLSNSKPLLLAGLYVSDGDRDEDGFASLTAASAGQLRDVQCAQQWS